jgi:hypothetical protein
VWSKSKFQHLWKGACSIKYVSAWLERGMVKKDSFSMPGKGWTDWTENSQTGRRRRRRRRRRFAVPRPGATLSHQVKMAFRRLFGEDACMAGEEGAGGV